MCNDFRNVRFRRTCCLGIRTASRHSICANGERLVTPVSSRSMKRTPVFERGDISLTGEPFRLTSERDADLNGLRSFTLVFSIFKSVIPTPQRLGTSVD